MKHIETGMVLKLKPERQADYAMDCPLVRVTGIKQRDGYKTPWIVSAIGIFKPQDFASFECWDTFADRHEIRYV